MYVYNVNMCVRMCMHKNMYISTHTAYNLYALTIIIIFTYVCVCVHVYKKFFHYRMHTQT